MPKAVKSGIAVTTIRLDLFVKNEYSFQLNITDAMERMQIRPETRLKIKESN
jgi:hypothetical protein